MVERTDTVFTWAFDRKTPVRIPVAHGEGRYVADAETLARLEGEGQVVLRYLKSSPGTEGNPNMSSNDIAGDLQRRWYRRRHHAAPRAGRRPEARLGRRSPLHAFARRRSRPRGSREMIRPSILLVALLLAGSASAASAQTPVGPA